MGERERERQRERRVVPSFHPNPQLNFSLYLPLFRLCVWDPAVQPTPPPPTTPYSSHHVSSPVSTYKDRQEGGGWGRERETG